ncbi:unnamed protein product [Rhodiola kirilowii]
MNHFILATIFLVVCLTKPCICLDSKFAACKSRSCTSNGQQISYPFYIKGVQESYCGMTGFEVSCGTNGEILYQAIPLNTYRIEKIDYVKQQFNVVNVRFLDLRDTCEAPERNLTLRGLRFDFVPNQNDSLYLYTCPNSSIPKTLAPYEFHCSTPTENDASEKTFVAMFGDDANLGDAVKECGPAVSTTVELQGNARRFNGSSKAGDWGYYKEVLRRGFWLEWKATNCTECAASGGRCGFDEDDYRFWCYCPDRPHALLCRSEINRGLIIGLVTASFVLMVLLSTFVIWCLKRKYASAVFLMKRMSSNLSSRSDVDTSGLYFGVPVFSYTELEEATNHFAEDRELGDGGYGVVYYGVLQDGREVAVKRLYEHNYRKVEQFMNEVEILTRLRHSNLVSLYGCTSRKSRALLLVYEFIPNGTVADHLHGDRASLSPLSWPIRMSIAIETASALAYLHASEIIHRDVKTNNILLDNSFSVKVADFGLSRLFPTDATHVSTAPQGTPGYVDPEYYQCYQLSDRSDVYSFGVVLIELISSLQAVDMSRSRDDINLSNLAITKIQNRALQELIDPNLGQESNPAISTMISSVAELAFRCLQQDKEMRPSMNEVLEVLKQIQSSSTQTEKPVDIHMDRIKNIAQPSPSPEADHIRLLKKMEEVHSTDSISENWTTSSSSLS